MRMTHPRFHHETVNAPRGGVITVRGYLRHLGLEVICAISSGAKEAASLSTEEFGVTIGLVTAHEFRQLLVSSHVVVGVEDARLGRVKVGLGVSAVCGLEFVVGRGGRVELLLR